MNNKRRAGLISRGIVLILVPTIILNGCATFELWHDNTTVTKQETSWYAVTGLGYIKEPNQRLCLQLENRSGTDRGKTCALHSNATIEDLNTLIAISSNEGVVTISSAAVRRKTAFDQAAEREKPSCALELDVQASNTVLKNADSLPNRNGTYPVRLPFSCNRDSLCEPYASKCTGSEWTPLVLGNLEPPLVRSEETTREPASTRPLALRLIATPFSVAFDAITSPFQLVWVAMLMSITTNAPDLNTDKK